MSLVRKVWGYQRGNQNPQIKEEQTTQWTIEKVQKDKQWSTKHTYKTKDRATRTPLKPREITGILITTSILFSCIWEIILTYKRQMCIVYRQK
jgi:hypothetical protein